jgi:DNA polymerase III subunit epsilon
MAVASASSHTPEALLQQLLSCTEAVAIDFETTGYAPEAMNAPWQIGLVVISQGRVDMSRSFQSLLRVGEEHAFNPYTPGRWAQLRHELAQAPTLQELWPELRPLLQEKVLVAHHAPTERGILAQEFPLQSFGPWVDTLAVAKAAYPKCRNYKLENLAPTLGLLPTLQQKCPGLAPHDAFYDAVACATLLETVLTAPGWKDLTLEAFTRLTP